MNKTKPARNSVEEMIEQVVRAFARRVWWVEQEDLRQEAWAIALEWQDSFDLDKAKAARPDLDEGATLAGFLRSVCYPRLGAYLMRQHAPVHAGKNNLRVLKELVPVSLNAGDETAAYASRERVIGEHSANSMELRQFERRVDGVENVTRTAEDELRTATWQARTRQRLERLAAEAGITGQRGLDALLSDEPSAEHAKRTRRPLREVYAAKTRMRRAIRRDATMQTLVEELC